MRKRLIYRGTPEESIRNEEIHERMKKAIYSAGFSIKSFCDKTNVHRKMFYGYQKPNVYVLEVIADKCNVTIDWLVKGE